MNTIIRFRKIHEAAVIPIYASIGAAGLDLAASEDTYLYPNDVVLVPTGLILEIPNGYEGQIRPRSGLALNKKITVFNSPGTIDSDYRGEVKVMLINYSSQGHAFYAGDRIAQLVISPIVQAALQEVKQINELSSTQRNAGGFGSTGK